MTPERLTFWPLLLLVLLAPLPFGSVAPWAWGALGLSVGLLLATWAVVTYLQSAPPPVPLRKIWLVVLLFGITVVWVLVQISVLTPANSHHPLWGDAGRILGRELAGSIAVDPYEAGSALLRLLAYGGVFWLSLQACRDRRLAEIALYALAIVGFLYAAYGLVVEFSGVPMVLWYEKLHYRDNLTSTFINRNSYATYAGIGLLCVTALLARRVLRIAGMGHLTIEKLRILLRDLAERDWLLIILWGVIASALILTESRGGFVSTCIGILAFVIITGFSTGVSLRTRIGLVAVLIVAGTIFYSVSGDTLSQRLSGTSAESSKWRAELYSLTADALADASMVGMGYGSFEQIFHLYRGDEFEFHVRSVRAHNTYLENAMELGLPAAIALFVSIGILAVICGLGVSRRHRGTIYPAVGFAATLLVAAHSLVDFSLQIPAVAATYAMLMGLACAQSWSSVAPRQPRGP